MRFIGLAAAALCFLALGACGTLDKYASVVTQANLDVTRNTYETLLAGAATYNELRAVGPV